jgi:hypothetical protein
LFIEDHPSKTSVNEMRYHIKIGSRLSIINFSGQSLLENAQNPLEERDRNVLPMKKGRIFYSRCIEFVDRFAENRRFQGLFTEIEPFVIKKMEGLRER